VLHYFYFLGHCASLALRIYSRNISVVFLGYLGAFGIGNYWSVARDKRFFGTNFSKNYNIIRSPREKEIIVQNVF